jgi:hypothetical protein
MKPRGVAQEKLLLVNCVHWRGTISRSALCEAMRTCKALRFILK